MRFSAASIVAMMVFSIFIWTYVINTAWMVAKELISFIL